MYNKKSTENSQQNIAVALFVVRPVASTVQHAVQQIESLQQIHNILTCQDIVQLAVRLVVQHIHNKSK